MYVDSAVVAIEIGSGSTAVFEAAFPTSLTNNAPWSAVAALVEPRRPLALFPRPLVVFGRTPFGVPSVGEDRSSDEAT